MPQSHVENEDQYPINDSVHYTVIGILSCFLCALTGWAFLLGIALFGGVILAALQHAPPPAMLAAPKLHVLTSIVTTVFLVASLFQAKELGEYLIADELREKRKMGALAYRTR